MLLEVENVTLHVGELPILEGFSLGLEEGEIHSLLGVNGVGKSTLGNLIMGMQGLQPDAGRILLNGDDISSLSITQRAQRGVTLALQAPASFEGLTVERYLELSGRSVGSNGRVGDYLELVGLAPDYYLDRYVDERLSGGERRRIELASVAAMHPRLAILDEPDSGIDFLSLGEITGLIERMNRQGSAILLITHREEMALMAHRSSLMCAGQVIAAGAPSEVAAYFREHCDTCRSPNRPHKNGVPDELQPGV